jgi:hypothetical protein
MGQKADSSSSMPASTSRVVSLSHIKAADPEVASLPPPFLGSRMAHPGGKITSNKPQALAKFLAKKQGKGEIFHVPDGDGIVVPLMIKTASLH